MSSGASGNTTMDIDILETDDVDALSKRLLVENAELRKLMGLMQENMELRTTLRDHERKVRSLSPPGKSMKNSKDRKQKVPETRPRPNIKDEPQASDPLPHPDTKEEAQPSDPSPLPDPKEEAQPSDPSPHPDPEKVEHLQRIVGEIAFQLDRKILCKIFLEQQRLYGYRVANIKEKIIQVTTCPLTGKVDDRLRSELNRRYHRTMDELKKLGYDPKVHPNFTETLVNTYGIMKERTTTGTEDLSEMNDPRFLSKMITEHIVSEKVDDILIILNCLAYLAKQEGKSMFIW